MFSTNISGSVSGEWTLARATNKLTAATTVPVGSTFIIDSGVQVLTAQNGGWNYGNSFGINGTLNATGARVHRLDLPLRQQRWNSESDELPGHRELPGKQYRGKV